MERLHFGRRARRRARLKRMAVGVWVFALGGMAAGLPGPSVGLDLLGGLVGSSDEVARAGIETTKSAENMMRFRREVFAARPAPTTTPATAAAPAELAEEPATGDYGGSITDIIYAAAAEHGIDGDYMVSIASCESGLNPGAVNAAGYHGLFQYDYTTWSAFGYGSIYDPVAQARTTAELLAAGQASRWPNCA
ncbi:MAG: transglycosylase family protein [Actinomycetota bacterium]